METGEPLTLAPDVADSDATEDSATELFPAAACAGTNHGVCEDVVSVDQHSPSEI